MEGYTEGNSKQIHSKITKSSQDLLSTITTADSPVVYGPAIMNLFFSDCTLARWVGW
jgi:hypothetical protein